MSSVFESAKDMVVESAREVAEEYIISDAMSESAPLSDIAFNVLKHFIEKYNDKYEVFEPDVNVYRSTDAVSDATFIYLQKGTDGEKFAVSGVHLDTLESYSNNSVKNIHQRYLPLETPMLSDEQIADTANEIIDEIEEYFFENDSINTPDSYSELENATSTKELDNIRNAFNFDAQGEDDEDEDERNERIFDENRYDIVDMYRETNSYADAVSYATKDSLRDYDPRTARQKVKKHMKISEIVDVLGFYQDEVTMEYENNNLYLYDVNLDEDDPENIPDVISERDLINALINPIIRIDIASARPLSMKFFIEFDNQESAFKNIFSEKFKKRVKYHIFFEHYRTSHSPFIVKELFEQALIENDMRYATSGLHVKKILHALNFSFSANSDQVEKMSLKKWY